MIELEENLRFLNELKNKLNQIKDSMKIELKYDGIWYHGSNKIFTELRTNSTITQRKELAEAFSHQPSQLGYDDNGVIGHNGTEKGYLYIIDETIIVGKIPHSYGRQQQN